MKLIRHIVALFTVATLCCFSAMAQDGITEVTGSFVEQLQKRDSILIADQIRYGFELDSVSTGTRLALQDWSEVLKDTLTLVNNWQIDTLKVYGGRKSSNPLYRIRGSVVVAPFEAGEYHLPRIAVQRTRGNQVDTLLFEEQVMQVTTIPVDTTTYVLHDIKGQIRYPVTFREVVPYLLGALLLAALIALAVFFIRKHRKEVEAEAHKDPPYVVALRKLDHFRGDKYWAPEKQKAFYSGITDTLREYMAATFDIDACEMTTAEIFDALKGSDRLSRDLYQEAKDLFELADFVKFAKHIADEQDNAHALPMAVRFVTSTYQQTLEEETQSEVQADGVEKKEVQ